MSEFAKPSPASTNFVAPGIFEGSATPITVVRVLFTFGSLGSLEPSSNASGFLSSMRCFSPRAASPASYIPGVSLKRGSLASEPVIPAGSGGADSRPNGFPPPGLAGLVSGDFEDSGDGDGEVVCAKVVAAKVEPKTSDANSILKAILCNQFIVSPPKLFLAA